MFVYLVDDEYWIVAGLAQILGKQYPNIELRCFTNPLEALAQIPVRMPDLLITDIRMPQMSGIDLLEKVRALGLRFYAVLTGLDDTKLIKQSLRLQVSDYLIKPVNKSELFHLIDHVQEQLTLLEQRAEEKLPGMLRLCATYGHRDELLMAQTAAYRSALIVRFSGTQPTLSPALSAQFNLSVELWNLEQCCWLYLSEQQNMSVLGEMLRNEKNVLSFTLDDYTPEHLHEQFINTMKNDDQQRCNAIAYYCSTSPDNQEAAVCLIKQMKTHRSPPMVLDTFCAAVGLVLPFWRVVAITADCLQGKLDVAALNAQIHTLPTFITPHSKDVRLTMQWVQAHYAESVSLTQAAANVYLQANYFTTLFKKETGVSFIQYLNGLRVDAACRYILEHTDASFEQVSQANGFASLRYFFATFKKYTGLTPGDFRALIPYSGLVL